MKKLLVYAGLFLYLTMVISACSSLGKVGDSDAKDYKNQEQIINKQAMLPSGWEYKTDITNKGTRSEGSISRLYYRYKELPPYFNFVVIGSTSFVYKPMKVLWDDHGYLKTTNEVKIQANAKKIILGDEIYQGWYEADIGHGPYNLKTGTPSEWIYVQTDELAFWVSPNKIEAIAKIYNFHPIIVF